MLKYLDMTNKQQKFNSIFTDSNISEIIWYYKFCNKNDNIVAEQCQEYKNDRLYYTIKNYKVLKNTQYLFYEDFYYLIKELYNASKTDSSSLIDFKKYINNNILNNKNIDYFHTGGYYNGYYKTNYASHQCRGQNIETYFIKHKDYKSIKIKSCGYIISQYLRNIIKNKFDSEMLVNYGIDIKFLECVGNLHYAYSRKQFETYTKMFYEELPIPVVPLSAPRSPTPIEIRNAILGGDETKWDFNHAEPQIRPDILDEDEEDKEPIDNNKEQKKQENFYNVFNNEDIISIINYYKTQMLKTKDYIKIDDLCDLLSQYQMPSTKHIRYINYPLYVIRNKNNNKNKTIKIQINKKIQMIKKTKNFKDSVWYYYNDLNDDKKIKDRILKKKWFLFGEKASIVLPFLIQ
jgi:hypothetical protein